MGTHGKAGHFLPSAASTRYQSPRLSKPLSLDRWRKFTLMPHCVHSTTHCEVINGSVAHLVSTAGCARKRFGHDHVVVALIVWTSCLPVRAQGGHPFTAIPLYARQIGKGDGGRNNMRRGPGRAGWGGGCLDTLLHKMKQRRDIIVT